jgi:hypothetical protein
VKIKGLLWGPRLQRLIFSISYLDKLLRVLVDCFFGVLASIGEVDPGLPAGIYFVTIRCQKLTVTKKIVIQ